MKSLGLTKIDVHKIATLSLQITMSAIEAKKKKKQKHKKDKLFDRL